MGLLLMAGEGPLGPPSGKGLSLGGAGRRAEEENGVADRALGLCCRFRGDEGEFLCTLHSVSSLGARCDQSGHCLLRKHAAAGWKGLCPPILSPSLTSLLL